MNLNYNILWFDDDEDFFESYDEESIIREIKSWGFTPNVTKVSEPEKFMAYSPWKIFDLIVVDFTLDNSPDNGAAFISQVRTNQVFTEIIFYSSKQNSDLWAEIHGYQLEGVFVANRRLVESKVIRVAEQSVKKVLDLENMRGIVMARVGELDHLLEEIFIKTMEGFSDQQRTTILMRGHKKIKEQADSIHKSLERFVSSPNVEDLLKLSTDSHKKWRNFKRLCTYNQQLRELVTTDYFEEILKKRNFLAHGIPTESPLGGHIFNFNGEDYHFNDEESQNLRHKMNEYKEIFTQAIIIVSN